MAIDAGFSGKDVRVPVDKYQVFGFRGFMQEVDSFHSSKLRQQYVQNSR